MTPSITSRIRRIQALVVGFILIGCCVATSATADEVRVMTSGAFTAAHQALAAEFEKATTHTVVTIYGASLGTGDTTIPRRLERGEPADIVILAASALDDLIARGFVVAGSRVDLVRSTIGMAVRAGAPKPDISTLEALTRALLGARAVGYSSSASGVYLSTELFPRLGVADALKDRMRVSEGAVGPLIASGEVEIGFQQISELLPVAGIDIVGPLPAEAQRVTIFSAGIVRGAPSLAAAQELLRFYTSRAAASTIARTGLEPLGTP